jgi:hypothetical protein
MGDSIFGNIANYLTERLHKLLIPLKIQSYNGSIEHLSANHRLPQMLFGRSPEDE